MEQSTGKEKRWEVLMSKALVNESCDYEADLHYFLTFSSRSRNKDGDNTFC